MASVKVDDRSSFGSKRSRNDGDWTCPKCGNVNFSFRNVCNRGKCGAARPSAAARTGAVHLTNDFEHAPPYYFSNIAVPHAFPGGHTPTLGARLGFPPGSAAVPYGMLPAYPAGSLGGIGYGPVAAVDGYGYGYRGSPLPPVARNWSEGSLADNTSRKRRVGPDEPSEGDWVCPKCENVNFSFRTVCNMKKCGVPRPAPGGNRSKSGNKDDAPEGSWTCSKCSNLNYPFRTVCNRKGCGSEKPDADDE